MDCNGNTELIVGKEAVCKIGIIADVQYADIDDRYNFRKTRLRFYRKALTLLKRAVIDWTAEEVDCVFQLGDVIDGFNKDENASKCALGKVVEALKLFPGPVYHTWGNHELYNFSQEELIQSDLFSGNMPQCACPKGKSYFSFNIHRKLKVVVLNCYEISMLGLPEDSPEYKVAEAIIKGNNPKKNLNDPDGLQGTNRRFLKFNGAISASQLDWLKAHLREATANRVNVIVMGHCPIFELSAESMNLLLNFPDAMDVVTEYSECVVCYLAGHDHEGGSSVDSSGILHVTFPGTVESLEVDSYATAYLYNDRLVIQGKGSYSSYETILRFPLEEK
ncbi:manganese-dependent ADP-ribose/CDP-alcohol diphosphatase-like [Mizuhopecten yessoensis]|uniref:Manganese-dependent ADP-ribose/CDP-alcohol diphosphatase n=1 Tax=Mizuhopecten yessoensis TaxID=6573 RepID=A0A210QSW5_MIZYE|nr:manganese-dependent ADP-ribose/CDP-alcohol diphosphatase-like [Mizuhopecten yessoensis]XP_021350681.1 manganese-dependent ADP-ribose/CDP-alcohol diphosphatase-like [Mizuhopecten yessoensis]XP_021350682.1 manganese-dependent ADP-ribose/CDP-alcohol diphosphatase-like [Mizuhopecten yessoensis]XP_021350683.1 manganese-dependent ADP-ribose/CDP-alcohol diphosphatase-like [Mizuhopecten yessoensis]OWF51857.1 Manganese-dependent ADP-ribose/CDP-alcohol diphosphatase [Mizuhopecten yessoensis]